MAVRLKTILFALMIPTVLLTFSMVKSEPQADAATRVPEGFEDVLVTSLEAPTALAFTPDGRMLITTKTGQVRIYQNGELVDTPALDISGKICSNAERGMLGVAVDPNFANNRLIYIYYTFNRSGACPVREPSRSDNPVNRISRFVLAPDNTVDPASERILVDNIPSPNGNHNGGDLNFGKDRMLYATVGDGGCDYATPANCQVTNDAARDQNVLLGKILRITRSSAIPTDNPNIGEGSVRCNRVGVAPEGSKCQEIFATGLRNPFRFAFDPDASETSFYINDVGAATWEEIDRGANGADYGWNIREGRCVTGSTTNCGQPPIGLTNPIYSYAHTTGCQSITGGAFVPNGVWPEQYDDSYLYGDFVCGKIFEMIPRGDGSGFTRKLFASGLGSGGPVHMTFGPSEVGRSLYYTTFADGGQIRTISD